MLGHPPVSVRTAAVELDPSRQRSKVVLQHQNAGRTAPFLAFHKKWLQTRLVQKTSGHSGGSSRRQIVTISGPRSDPWKAPRNPNLFSNETVGIWANHRNCGTPL